jgi:hypothetical protein
MMRVEAQLRQCFAKLATTLARILRVPVLHWKFRAALLIRLVAMFVCVLKF